MSKDLKKNTTTIHEYARLALGITRDEYALCSYVQYRCADSRSKQRGYCSDTKKDIAEFVGITKRGLLKMIERLEGLGLIERSALGYLGVTPHWIDTDSEHKKNNKNGEQSSLQMVNKVHSKGEQSSLDRVNKVHSYNKVKDDIKEDKYDYYVEREVVAEAAERTGETLPFEGEKKYTPPIPAAPPKSAPLPENPYTAQRPATAAAPDALAQLEWLETLETDYRIPELLQAAHGVPKEKHLDYLAAFRARITMIEKVHPTYQRLKEHYLNFCNSRWIDEQKTKSNDASPGPARKSVHNHFGGDASKYTEASAHW